MPANKRSTSTRSSTTTTTRYWHRNDTPRPWWPVGLLSVLGLAVLFLFGALITAPAIQAEVKQGVDERLRGSGYLNSDVSADGRQIAIRLTEPLADEVVVRALAASTTCQTWLGEMACPSIVDVERDSGNDVKALASTRADQFEVVPDVDELVQHRETLSATAQVEVDAGAAAGAVGQFESQALEQAVTVRQDCNEAFDDVLSKATIRFQTASATIDAGNEELLEQLASLAGDCPGNLTVEGHTDSRGDADMNKALSLARAAAVRDALAALGVDALRMNAVGHGEAMPVADNASAAGRASNRRIAISVEET